MNNRAFYLVMIMMIVLAGFVLFAYGRSQQKIASLDTGSTVYTPSPSVPTSQTDSSVSTALEPIPTPNVTAIRLSFREKLSKDQLVALVQKLQSKHELRIKTLIYQWEEHKAWYPVPKDVPLTVAFDRSERSYQNFLATRLEILNASLLYQPVGKVFINAKSDLERQIEEYKRNGFLISSVVVEVPQELAGIHFDDPNIETQR